MKKYLLMLFAATLCLGFTACGDDEKEDPQPQPEPKPEVIAFDDYSSTLGMSLNAVLQKYGEPSMNLGSFLAYQYEQGKVTTLSIVLNPDNNQVYTIFESLVEDAYKAEDIRAYFASKYHFYGKEEVPADEEEGTPAIDTYTYGNNEKPELATIYVTVAGNSMVTYVNPQNVPEEPEVTDLGDMSAIEAINTFLGEDIEDILDEYGDAFQSMGNTYLASVVGDDYLTSVAVIAEEGTVTSLGLFFDEDLEVEEVLDYFKANGFTVTNTGAIDDDGYAIYSITNDAVNISFSCEVAIVSMK